MHEFLNVCIYYFPVLISWYPVMICTNKLLFSTVTWSQPHWTFMGPPEDWESQSSGDITTTGVSRFYKNLWSPCQSKCMLNLKGDIPDIEIHVYFSKIQPQILSFVMKTKENSISINIFWFLFQTFWPYFYVLPNYFKRLSHLYTDMTKLDQ